MDTRHVTRIGPAFGHAIIGILAAVLILNLLNARSRAFDTAAQTCLKELSVQQEVVASNSPFEYDDTGRTHGAAGTGGVTIGTDVLNACEDVEVVGTIAADGSTFSFTGEHLRGTTNYTITNGTGVVPTP